MSELTTKRTLVKSPPELWAEVSDLDALAKHLGEFGEIKITRLEPETTVVWEGDRVSGTVQLEPSGWGTKVTLTAELRAMAEPPALESPAPVAVAVAVEPPPSTIDQAPEPEPAAELVEPEPEPVAEEPTPVAEARKPGFWARLFGRKPVAPPPAPTPEPVPVAEVLPVEEPPPPPPVEEPPAPEPPPLQPVPDPDPPAPDEPDDPLPAAQLDDDRAVAVLTEVLDNLGSAHHRPFSRG
jgi:hypothetical protein